MRAARKGGSVDDDAARVTRFGEILPLWQNRTGLWKNVDGIFSIWQNFEPTLQKYDIWRIFIVTNGQILNSFRATWSLWMLLFHSRKSDDFKSFKFDAQETDEAT